MGWISFLLTQAVVTSVTLGAMKRQGLIQVNSKNIENDTARYAMVKLVDLGEDICIFGENLFVSLTNEIERAKRDRK